MKIISLFDGISAAQVAIRRLGIKEYQYYACEIDKHAIKVTQSRWPNTIQLGDVSQVDFTQFKDADLVVFGSPCQGFSYAGKQLNFEDPRSKLFFEAVRAIKECKPKYFLMENVKMKKEFQKIISEHLGVEPIEINSALVSAQNRKRLYWTNIPNVGQPEDRKIYLKDILITNGDPICYSTSGRGNGKVEFRLSDNKKAHTLTATGYSNRSFSGVVDGLDFVCGLEQGRRLDDGKNLSRNYSEGYRVYSENGKSVCLTAKTKGGLGGYTGLYLTSEEIEKLNHTEKAIAYMNRKVKDGRTHWDFEHHSDVKDDKSRTLVANLYKGVPYNVLKEGHIIRKLHPIECERLQTFPDGYTDGISNTQRYKALGNSFTVEVIAHILKNIL